MRLVLLLGLLGCRASASQPVERAPSIVVAPVARDVVCVTRGSITDARISEPTVRAFARSTRGDAVALGFYYVGVTSQVRELASGARRFQLGLKLRAQDSCNVIYVMWRTDSSKLVVSIKRNPGMRTHEQCGANGYVRVKASRSNQVGALEPNATHSLRAEIIGDDLTAWVDDRVMWQGTLPELARSISGPVGFRTDNVVLDHLTLSAATTEGAPEACAHDDRTEE